MWRTYNESRGGEMVDAGDLKSRAGDLPRIEWPQHYALVHPLGIGTDARTDAESPPSEDTPP